MNLDIPIIGILRGVSPDFFPEIMAASFTAGLQAIEVTLNTPKAENIISDCRSLVPEGKLLGMGTVCNLEEAKRAAGAGAMFIVTPNLDTEVIDFARTQGIKVVSGALSPTEVYTAWHAGADLVKVFPCQALGGPRYIRDLLGPFDQAPLAAVGGVDAGNARDYLTAGAKAVGVGPTLFGKEALAQKNSAAIADNVKKFIAQL